MTSIAVQPDGRNINEGCGSTHVSRLAELVVRGGHDLGFAFDGDGDRVLAVDREGAIVDGDELMALGALHLRQAGRLPGDGVVVTVMTNYGFHAAMAQARIDVATTPVGDRNVLAELRTRGGRSGASSRGTSSRRTSTRRATASRGPCWRSRRSTAVTCTSATRCTSCPSSWSTYGCVTAARWSSRASARGDRPRASRAAWPRARARACQRHRATRARDGRGADRGRRREACASGW